MMAEWLKGCEICDSGLCDRFQELIDSGKTENSAAHILEKEQKSKLGIVVYSANALRKRRARIVNRGEKGGQLDQEFENCAVSDLYELIKHGKKFSTIYADPPWPYQNQATRSATSTIYKKDEWFMSLDDLKALPVPELTTENAHLHLWTTNAFIFEAKAIMDAWGFEYKSCFVWVKPQMGIGNYWRVSHEFMLFGLKGKQPFLDRGQKSWKELNRTKHSKKPEDVALTIEKVSPGPWIELFGRKTRDNWTVWGNEIERDLFNKSAFGT